MILGGGLMLMGIGFMGMDDGGFFLLFLFRV